MAQITKIAKNAHKVFFVTTILTHTYLCANLCLRTLWIVRHLIPVNRAANLFFSLRANISYCKIAQNIFIWTLTKTFFISASTLKLAEETRGRSIITILQAYSLKELYTSDTTLPQMIDLTPPSNELWGKIRSDPPSPIKIVKEVAFRSHSVRSRSQSVRSRSPFERSRSHLYGPVRILNGPIFFFKRPCGGRGGG